MIPSYELSLIWYPIQDQPRTWKKLNQILKMPLILALIHLEIYYLKTISNYQVLLYYENDNNKTNTVNILNAFSLFKII